MPRGVTDHQFLLKYLQLPIRRTLRKVIRQRQTFMGGTYASINEKLKEWLLAQKIFFVATAPLSQEGHVNCSPKDGSIGQPMTPVFSTNSQENERGGIFVFEDATGWPTSGEILRHKSS
jgi:Pyridoxamine 5'-phosphate oxidase